MCGITGILVTSCQVNGLRDNATLMADAIVHRGPDDGDVWVDEKLELALAHRRLSIVDLTIAGRQPMLSACGGYVFVFNGEVYNHLMLRRELESLNVVSSWRGHSDTETILAGIAHWGLKATIQKCIGMFAFALWDKINRTLTLGRDRLGEKPLYYGWQGEGKNAVFLFGSELKALKAHPAFSSKINRNALALFMRHSYIPAPYSIWENICKLQPGCLLTVSLRQPEPVIESYWSGKQMVETALHSPFIGTADQAVTSLDALLRDAIGQQMLADVPLGAFLSGGVDSSTVVALMQAQSNQPVRTFSIGFNEAQYNEAEHAKAVAKHLGTDHTELYVTPEDALKVIPSLQTLYDEPFADCSQIPTFLVAKMARQHVTVALSGDAGDELFCGYNRYLMASRMWGKLSHLPVGMRRAISNGLTALSPSAWDRIANPLMSIMPNRFGMMNVGDKLHKGAGVLASRTSSELYLNLVSHWQDPAKLVIGAVEPSTILTNPKLQPITPAGVEHMMALDMLTYLPDDILAKVDRAAMGVSLETRVPFLDHRVVEFAWQLPLQYKLQRGVGKWVLRQVLYKYVPKVLIERPKMGFSVPIDDWLRGSLRDWAEALLDENRLENEGFFDPQLVRRKWNEHLSGSHNWQNHLWDVLMFQAWLQEQ
jgi:asparagine synthase (glutamine-hydrolysing)